MLHEFITSTVKLLSAAVEGSRRTSISPPTEAEMEHGVPLLLDLLADALRLGESGGTEISTRRGSPSHKSSTTTVTCVRSRDPAPALAAGEPLFD